MNKVKFRVWCRNKNEWERDECFLDSGGKLLHMMQSGRLMTCTEGSHDIQLFSGLHDKNGKEIYEGDILIWHNTTNDVKRTCFVVYEPASFYVRGLESHDCHFPNHEAFELEVVGNIYETQSMVRELLEVK